MKALLLVNHKGGTGKIVNHINKIVQLLKIKFETVDSFICEEVDDFIKKCQDACGNYDALLFAGGDGTFHLAINALANMENVPTLGVIPSGTLCDAAKNFGVSKNIKKAIRIINEGNSKEFDIASINNDYFIFSASYGVYSDIPYSVTRKTKKALGHFAYYFKAVPEMFKHSKVNMELTIDDKQKLEIITPFLLIMNSKYMAGFKINKKSDISDGLIDVFYSKPEPFNGLFSYFIFKKRVHHIQCKSLHVCVHDGTSWDIDGEKGTTSSVDIKVLPKRFKMFFKNKNN